MVMVEVPDPGAGIVVGLKLTVVPVGTPVAERAMELLKPLATVVVIVELPCLPCITVTELGFAEIVKVPVALTVNVVLPLIDPLVALMVVDPAATAEASPVLEMVATEGLLEVQVAELVRF